MSNAAVNTLQTTISDSSAALSADALQLKQINVFDEDQDVTLSEIEKMVERAKSGVSARTVMRESCPMVADAEAKTLMISYDIAVLQSRLDLDFSLSTNIGVLSSPVVVREYVEFSVVFKDAAFVDLGFMLADISKSTWEYQPHTPGGERLAAKQVTVSGTRLQVDEPIFGVLRVSGRKVYKNCKLAVAMEKDELKIEDLQPVIIANWAGDPVDLALSTPRCAADALAWCAGDPGNPFFNEETGSETGLSSTCVENEEQEKEGSYLGYYSKCSGDFIMVVRNDDGGGCK